MWLGIKPLHVVAKTTMVLTPSLESLDQQQTALALQPTTKTECWTQSSQDLEVDPLSQFFPEKNQIRTVNFCQLPSQNSLDFLICPFRLCKALTRLRSEPSCSSKIRLFAGTATVCKNRGPYGHPASYLALSLNILYSICKDSKREGPKKELRCLTQHRNF